MLMADLHLLPKKVGRRRAGELLERFELTEAGDKPASTYSGGMKRKLDLAMTLVGNPKVIFLDEPTTGLDPRSRRTMWDIIRELVAEGTTILLTTQYLDEADQLAHRLAPTGRDDDALTLQLAGDGRVSTLRTLLRQLDDASVKVEALTVHTPDLDDVFFALTGKKGA